jgi:hypothetical protein
VEPVAFYLNLLPSPPGVIKENAAMDAKITDPEVDFGLMYFMDPGDLVAHGITLEGPYAFMFGISSFGSVQDLLLNAYRREAVYAHTPSIFFQRRRLVPRVSMEELYVKHSVRDVGVVKLDCEGLDVAIMATFLTFIEKYHLSYPCVISYEVLTTNADFLPTVEMLQRVGYQVISLTHPLEVASGGDFLAMHSHCSAARRHELRPFLPASLDRAVDMCRRRRGGEEGEEEAYMYCCVTQHGSEGNDDEQDPRMELCNQYQPFFVPVSQQN